MPHLVSLGITISASMSSDQFLKTISKEIDQNYSAQKAKSMLHTIRSSLEDTIDIDGQLSLLQTLNGTIFIVLKDDLTSNKQNTLNALAVMQYFFTKAGYDSLALRQFSLEYSKIPNEDQIKYYLPFSKALEWIKKAEDATKDRILDGAVATESNLPCSKALWIKQAEEDATPQRTTELEGAVAEGAIININSDITFPLTKINDYKNIF